MRSRSRGLFIASHKSLRRCTLSQKSGLLPNAREDQRGSRRHIAAVVAQLVEVLALDPMASASAACVSPVGCMNSSTVSRRPRPACASSSAWIASSVAVVVETDTLCLPAAAILAEDQPPLIVERIEWRPTRLPLSFSK